MIHPDTLNFKLFYRAQQTLGSTGLTQRWRCQLSDAIMSSHKLAKLKRHNQKLFQLIGIPRSGTSILSVALDSHPDIICLSEPYLSWLQGGRFQLSCSAEHLMNDTMTHLPPTDVIQQICRSLPSTNQRVGFKETFRDLSHPTFPSQPFLMKNAQYQSVEFTIAILRDPRDIWVSTQTRFEGIRYELDQSFTDCWNTFAQWILNQNIFYVRYEDLAHNPAQTLQTVCQYLDRPMHSSILAPKPNKGEGDQTAFAGGSLSSRSVCRYKDELDPISRAYIETACATLMTQFDYQFDSA
jgi:hypothetical protein